MKPIEPQVKSISSILNGENVLLIAPTRLGKIEEIQIKFLKDILKAELTYARTRGFWDNN